MLVSTTIYTSVTLANVVLYCVECNRPITRTVSDAVHVLDAIVGYDYNDQATREASKYILSGGYEQFLQAYGLKGKRLGIVRDPFFTSGSGSLQLQAFEKHFQTLR